MKQTIKKYAALAALTLMVGVPAVSSKNAPTQNATPKQIKYVPEESTRLDVNYDNYDIIYLLDFTGIVRPQELTANQLTPTETNIKTR